MHLRQYIEDGNAVGVDLMDIDIPWESRMNEAKERSRWLASKLCKVDFIMRTAEVRELDRGRVEGRFKEVVIDRRAVVGKM